MTELPESAARDPRFIVVEGPIGVGKTTLARRLADSFGFEVLLEGAADNPFLDRFYAEGRRNALPTQLFFLLQRAEQLRAQRAEDLFKPSQVADFLLDKDRLFAEITLDENELALYDQVHAQLDIEAPKPDLVIYLQAPPPVLQARIRQRAIPSERHIDDAYLESLVEAYARFFHFYDDAPLLIVNAAEIDLVHDHEQYERLVDVVRDFRSVRSYFNPQPSLI
ncbi:MAG TPA: deoxynucleoside kinase [Pseudomonadales bacterium]|nr:deoxynucleoside kinase [Pseudomonadales bacterium]